MLMKAATVGGGGGASNVDEQSKSITTTPTQVTLPFRPRVITATGGAYVGGVYYQGMYIYQDIDGTSNKLIYRRADALNTDFNLDTSFVPFEITTSPQGYTIKTTNANWNGLVHIVAVG